MRRCTPRTLLRPRSASVCAYTSLRHGRTCSQSCCLKEASLPIRMALTLKSHFPEHMSSVNVIYDVPPKGRSWTVL